MRCVFTIFLRGTFFTSPPWKLCTLDGGASVVSDPPCANYNSLLKSTSLTLNYNEFSTIDNKKLWFESALISKQHTITTLFVEHLWVHRVCIVLKKAVHWPARTCWVFKPRFLCLPPVADRPWSCQHTQSVVSQCSVLSIQSVFSTQYTVSVQYSVHSQCSVLSTQSVLSTHSVLNSQYAVSAQYSAHNQYSVSVQYSVHSLCWVLSTQSLLSTQNTVSALYLEHSQYSVLLTQSVLSTQHRVSAEYSVDSQC